MRSRKSLSKGASIVRTERLESRQMLCSAGPGVFVNAGGPDYLDAAQQSWAADSGFTGGVTSDSAFAVKSTAEQGLYDSNHFGSNFNFAADADSGGYTLTLLFADPAMNKPGMRIFNVFAQGKEILKNFDLASAGGPRTAISRSFPVTISDDELDLTFQGVKGDAIVSGIELVPLPIPPAKPSGLSATADLQTQVTLNWTDHANNETGFEIDRSPDGKTNWQNIGSVATDGNTYADTSVQPGTTYYYRVQSTGQYGSSPFITTSVKTPGTKPAAVSATVTPSLVAAPGAMIAPSALDATPLDITTGNDIQKITWTQLTGEAQSPVGRTEAETATVNGKIYCFGGYTDSTLVPMAVSDVFDPVAGTWTKLPDMPIGETHAGTTTDGRYIYMAGGYTGPGGAGAQIFAVTNVFKFDTQSNTWSKIQNLPAARGAGSLVLLGDTLHFMGGTDLARKDQTTHWSLNLDDPNATWQTETPLNQARNHLGGVALNGKIYVVAGQLNQDPNFTTVGTVEIWDPATGKWTNGAPLPVTRSHIAGATFVYNGQIIVMGGDHTYLHDVTNVTSYDPIANKWTDLTPLPIARSSGCGTVINGVFYYMTGNISKNCYKGILTLSGPVTQPTTPLNQNAVATSNVQIKVTWSAVNGATSYQIFRNTDGSTTFSNPPITIQDTGAAAYSYLDNTVSPNTQYFYEVLAVNSAGTSPAPATLATATTPLASPVTVIVDDKAATLVGTWTSGNTTSGFYGTDYLSDGDTHGGKSATFTPNLATDGSYQVFARWTAAASRATNVPFDIVAATGTTTVTVNQQQNGGVFFSLGTFQFNAGTGGSVTIRNTNANGYVIADAVEFVPAGAATPTAVIVDDTAATKVGAWTSGNTTSGFYGVDYLSDGKAGGGKSVTFTPNLSATGTYAVYARWTAATSRATNVPIDITHQGTTTTVTVNQQQNGGIWFLLGAFTFDAGLTSSVTIRDDDANGYVIADAVEFVPM